MRKLCSIILFVTAFSGCASIVSGTKQKVAITTEPAKVQIEITSQTGQEFYSGEPIEIELPRKNTYTVAVTMEGYITQKIVISQSLNGWFWGNLCCGGIVGMAVDFVTGAMWTLEPDSIKIKLKTALFDTKDGPVIVFFATDKNGGLRSLQIPMIRA